VPNRGTVYASIPVCGSIIADYEACRDGRIVEYDLATKQLVATHRFLSPDFYGRLELLVCLPETVEVGVQASVYRGQRMVQTAMSFSVADPSRFTPIVAGRELGNTLAYDATHDALFYTSEFNNLLVRLDRKTGQFDDTASQDLVKPWHEPVTLQPFGGSYILAPHAVHLGRNRLYITEWLGGNFVHAIDLTTLRKVASYDMGSGAGLGISIDPERDRLFVSSLWGLEVFDLKTDALILRRRIGLGNRPVVIDPPRNRLYVSSMVEGKVRILDRDTLSVIGQVPIGMGSRYPHLTHDGTTLYASSLAAHYAFDPDELVR
jgi:DNA-binding beta-propeller fold protein YncE